MGTAPRIALGAPRMASRKPSTAASARRRASTSVSSFSRLVQPISAMISAMSCRPGESRALAFVRINHERKSRSKFNRD